ncbi:MAG: SpvB/TcaC N-terminal domain-containing protein [Candidatus Nanopelagicales bacterium]
MNEPQSPDPWASPAGRGEHAGQGEPGGRGEQGGQAAEQGWAATLGPPPSLPKGGGAIRGMGEKFAANVATGAGTFTIPIPASPGRAGFGPVLNLSYDSARGNGPFGLGWSLDTPSISRKTARGVPLYGEDDVFILSGAEDLVPTPDAPDQTTEPGCTITRYRPRVEGLFARIERWVRADGDTHWRVLTRDNILNTYGPDANSRIADPANPTRVFSWLLSHTRDDRGNVVAYQYRADDGVEADLAKPSEANRGPATDPRRRVNRYLKSIRYANRLPLLDPAGRRPRFLRPAQIEAAEWLFELVLDYGEHDSDAPTPDDAGDWSFRADPHATHRPGFEVRTTRLCQRFLMFHHIPETPEAPGYDGLVNSVELTYASEVDPTSVRRPIYSQLVSVTKHGYRRDGAGYVQRSLPPLELAYSEPEIDRTVREYAGEDLPAGLVGLEWTDLHGEGIPGLLLQSPGSWYYRRNLSPLTAPAARFQSPAAVPSRPSVAVGAQVLDLAGDGLPDVVNFDGPLAGLYEHDADEGWDEFRPFPSPLQISSREPALRLADLTGDGRADALISAGSELWWYPALGEAGFGPQQRVLLPADAEAAPQVDLADGRGGYQLADLDGDGLADLVRIANGEISYWPSLGYGRFGARVVMDHSPTFDTPDQFDARRVRLADVDGSGTTDLIYLHRQGVRLYFNQSGNGWAEPVELAFPALDDASEVAVLDLLGTGTAALVWSTPLEAAAGRGLRYVNLLTAKPHLLVSSTNNLGDQTVVNYAPSTRFYLEDRLAGNPWLTRLPFPVHVLERVVSIDRISRNRFTTSYRYHHGRFDGVEREFAGFGMVESIAADDRTDGDDGAQPWRPPTLTCTWFHTGVPDQPTDPPGAFGDPTRRLRQPEVAASGLRALRGQVLRTETYGLDGTPAAVLPFAVTQSTFGVRELQAPVRTEPDASPGSLPSAGGVHLAEPRETLTISYERQAADPRVRHDFTLETDAFGNVLRAMSVAYPRRTPTAEPGLSPQATAAALAISAAPLIRGTSTQFTQALQDPDEFPDDHRTPLPARTATAALTWPTLPTNRLATWEQAQAAWTLAQANPVAGERLPQRDLDPSAPAPAAGWRVVVDQLIRYRRDDLTGLLPVGQLQPRALPGTSYRLALTAGQVSDVLGDLADPPILAEAGYIQLAGEPGWWAPNGSIHFSPGLGDSAGAELAQGQAHFFLPRRVADPFGAITTARYDAFDLLKIEGVDPVGNTSRGRIDYRVLAPHEVTDANGCLTRAAFDALGAVAGVAVLGMPAEPTGDSLAGFVADLPEAAELALIADLTGAAAALASATSRTITDRAGYWRTRETASPDPPSTMMLNRERHTPADPGATSLQIAVAHFDGMGREVQRKNLAEPGPVGDGGPVPARRWVGSSWVVYNRAGEPAQTFEPFFSRTHRFELDRRAGLATSVMRDPLGRVIARLHPDSSWEKTVIAAWRHETWDRTDTVLFADPRQDPDLGPQFAAVLGAGPYVAWRQQRTSGSVGDTPAEIAAEQAAAGKAAILAGTPAISLLDPAGRLALGIVDGGPLGKFANRITLDLLGRPLAVTDALGRRVVEQASRVAGGYLNGVDGFGRTLCRNSLDSGPHLQLSDAEGHPVRARDARRVSLRWRYDAARRPTHLYARSPGGAEVLAQRWVYGEGVPTAAGRIYRIYDSSGLTQNSRYDALGDITDLTRQLTAGYRDLPDWSALADLTAPDDLTTAAALLLEDARYRRLTWYDAIGRPVQTTSPHNPAVLPSVLRYAYGAGGLLDRLDVWVRRPSAPTDLLDPATADLRVLTDIEYDEHGRVIARTRGNGTTTRYRYHQASGQLRALTTTRTGFPADARVLQELGYTADPVGNIVGIRDTADLHNVVYFRNQRVEPSAEFTYDHLYRLVRATGREHVGLGNGQPAPPTQPGPSDAPRTGLAHPGDGNALLTYTESYAYDAAGNLTEVTHDTASGRWRRGYRYAEPSAIDPAQTGNCLSATGPAADAPATWTDRYTYDPAGATLSLPHLPSMNWDLGGRLAATATQVVAAAGAHPETTYYDYDGDGDRTRLTIDRAAGPGMSATPRAQRVFLGGLEIDREFAPDGSVTLQRETLRVDAGQETVMLVETRTIGADPGPAQLVRHQYANHLGSATLELGEDASVISYEEYFPYGGTAYAAVRAGTEAPKRDRYLGKQRDPSGLYQIGVRYYAPWLGRWLSPDPGELTDGPNVYHYAGANPISLRDVTGREIEAYYIAPGRPGNQRFLLFLGIAAHRLIAYHYVGSHLGEKAGIYTNFTSISTILTDSNIGDPNRLSTKEAAAKPDIANVASREVFEIKPWNAQGEIDARKESKDYRDWLNKGMGVPAGGRGDSGPAKYPFLLGRGVDGELAVQFHGGKMVWRLVWKTTEDGVVLYKWQQTNKTDRDEIKEAGEGQWVDVTEADAQAYAEELYAEVDRSLGRRATLFKTMDITNTVQTIVGTVAMTLLMGAILSGLRTGVAPRPGVGAPPPGVRPPITPPAPPPTPPPTPVGPRPPTGLPPWMLPPPGWKPPPTIGPGL